MPWGDGSSVTEPTPVDMQGSSVRWSALEMQLKKHNIQGDDLVLLQYIIHTDDPHAVSLWEWVVDTSADFTDVHEGSVFFNKIVEHFYYIRRAHDRTTVTDGKRKYPPGNYSRIKDIVLVAHGITQSLMALPG